jgi:hypothetical protein
VDITHTHDEKLKALIEELEERCEKYGRGTLYTRIGNCTVMRAAARELRLYRAILRGDRL